jgi:hypothetical protein
MSAWEYFTPEQQEKMMKRVGEFSQEQLKRFRKESNELISTLRSGLETGLPSVHPQIVSSARRLEELKKIFNVRDLAIEQAIERFHVENPDLLEHGMDLKLYRYIRIACNESTSTEP